MKTKISIAFFLLSFCSCLAWAQEVRLDKNVTVKVPSEISQISESSRDTFIKKNKLDSITARKGSKKKYFTNGTTLVSLGAATPAEKVDLLKIKKAFDEMAEGNTTSSSVIRKVNGNEFLIFTFGKEKINFFGTDASHTILVTGSISTNNAEFAKASVILEKVLKNIVIKQ